MFDSSSLLSMQVDPPPLPSNSISTSTSISTTTLQNSGEKIAPIDAPARDIAAGAIQRERRKRDKLKEWQIAPKSGLSATPSEDSEEDDDQDAGDNASGLVAQAQRLIVSVLDRLRARR